MRRYQRRPPLAMRDKHAVEASGACAVAATALPAVPNTWVLRRGLQRRPAIEPIIGHTKHDSSMGDAITLQVALAMR